MTRLARSLVNFLKREDGPTAVECALMLALIVVVCIVAINSVHKDPTVTEPTVVQTAQ